MTSPDLRAGDRVLFRSIVPADATYAPFERTGTLIADPMGMWVRIHYDGAPEPDSALVETLTRLDAS